MPEEFHASVLFALEMWVSAFEERSIEELREEGYPLPLGAELAESLRNILVSRETPPVRVYTNAFFYSWLPRDKSSPLF